MKIYGITSNLNCCAKKTNNNHYHNVNKNQKPVQTGLNTAGAWFGFGMGFDLLSRKLQFFHSPMKNSLLINSILGTGAGICTGIQCKRKNSQ